MVTDLQIPEMDGIELLKGIREQDPALPVIFATASADVSSAVRAVRSGADDYLTKPFSFEELLARMRALMRRPARPRSTVLRVDDLRLDPATHRAWRGETELALTAREFAMLEVFMRRPGEVLSRFELLEQVWDENYENRSNVIEVYVGYLRDKVDRPFDRHSLETVRGAGYRLLDAEAAA